jgi:hypothetical protein
LRGLRAQHGEAAIAEALQVIARNAHGETGAWDSTGHRAAVSRAIDRLLVRRAEDPESFPDDGVKI